MFLMTGWVMVGGRITTSSCSLDCDDGDLSEVGGKLRLTLLLHFGVGYFVERVSRSMYLMTGWVMVVVE